MKNDVSGQSGSHGELSKLTFLAKRLLRLALRNPKDLKHLVGLLDHYAKEIEDPDADLRAFPVVTIDDLLEQCGGHMVVNIHAFGKVPASISPLEAYALAILLRLSNATKVFEFGTYKGLSTTQLASNIEEGGQVFTLDLPENHPAYALKIDKPAEREIATEGGKGILIPRNLVARVTLLKSDSATFDTAPFRHSMDMVFVDGAHSYDYVENDSTKAFDMVRRGGVVVWHDCTPSHRDVVYYLKSLAKPPSVVAGTTLAFLKVA